MLISALLTAGYLLTISIKAFLPGEDYNYAKLVNHEPTWRMLMPMIVMTALAVILGIWPGGSDENVCRYRCISTLREEKKYAILFYTCTDSAACDRGYSAAGLSRLRMPRKRNICIEIIVVHQYTCLSLWLLTHRPSESFYMFSLGARLPLTLNVDGLAMFFGGSGGLSVALWLLCMPLSI